jgi:hypothetical protein
MRIEWRKVMGSLSLAQPEPDLSLPGLRLLSRRGGMAIEFSIDSPEDRQGSILVKEEHR